MEVCSGIYRLESSRIGAVFAVQGKETVLIDTGLPGLNGRILSELASLGIVPSSVSKILLTHHDLDHIGNSAALRSGTGAEIYASEEDIPYIKGEKSRPGVKRIIQRIVPHENPVIVYPYPRSGKMGEFSIIRTPGHTPGHVCIQYGKVLFSGDLFKFGRASFKLARDMMNVDTQMLRSSAALIRSLAVDWICPSHSAPFRTDDPLWQSFIGKF